MRTGNAERGMSLVEATIVLMVLAVLTSVLAPSIGDWVKDARQVKAAEEVEALALSVSRMLHDTGLPFPVRVAGASPSKAFTNRVDLLVSEGAPPAITPGTGVAASSADYPIQNAVEWDDPIAAEVERARDHLVTNAKKYTPAPAGSGSRPGAGWRGGYLADSIGPDPWGARYACATVWLNAGPGLAAGADGHTTHDAYCLSAGADGNVDTDMENSENGGVAVLGDDIISIIQRTRR